MKILVSACLLGVGCRYDGASKPNEKILAWLDRFEWIPVCPEILGGLPTPRIPAERREDGVFTQDGREVTEQYLRGARETLRLAELYGAKVAVLKARSPSCGRDEIYDGTFSRTLVPGQGIAAELLTRAGLTVFTEEDFDPANFCAENL